MIASKRKATNERVITGKPKTAIVVPITAIRRTATSGWAPTNHATSRRPTDLRREPARGTEGKSGTKGSIANISTEQKTRVKSVFSGHLVAPARDINVAVSVGVVVPRSVHFYPVPEDVVTIVPDYRGYEYFMIDDSQLAIVDPDTLEVVDIIVVT